MSWDNKILSSTEIGISRRYIQEIIEEWLKYEVKSGARYCMECFLARVIVHELRKKGVSVNVDDLRVEGGSCDFKIEPDYNVEIKKSLTGQHDLAKEIKRKAQRSSNSNPFLLIYLSVQERWMENLINLEAHIKEICGSQWALSAFVRLPHNGFAVLAKNMSQPPYSKSMK